MLHMLDHPTMIGCPSCAGCLRVDQGAHGHRQFVCSVGHAFSLWDLYEAKEMELERAQWSTIALLKHLEMILGMLFESADIPDAPEESEIRQRVTQIQQQMISVQHLVETTRMPTRRSGKAVTSQGHGEVYG